MVDQPSLRPTLAAVHRVRLPSRSQMLELPRNSLRCLLLLVLLLSSVVRADDEHAFQEGRSGNAELKYINDLPVLIVAGTPQEIGRQKAELTADATQKLIDYPRQLIERANRKDRFAQCLEMSKTVAAQIPADQRKELLAFAEFAHVDNDLGLLGNTIMDVYRGSLGCSSLIVAADHSATKGPLFGRNLDFPTLGILDHYSLVTVHRPNGKHAFASIGFPGLFGCLSGMNDAGLALAVHEVFFARDGAPIFNPKGVPYMFCFRRILEECATVDEAEKLLRATERTTILSLAVCDRDDSAVLEMTPDSVAARHGSDGILACTNHFRSEKLLVWPTSQLCNRYPKLIQARKLGELDVADVAQKLDDVNMGQMTVQTMIFEPATLKLHLAIGSSPSSALPLKLLELKPLLTP
jgi:isopenicillin-N N-acyltransferase like protein